MKKQNQEPSQNDSGFGIIMTQEDHEKYMALEDNLKKSKIQIKQLTNHIFDLAQKTIEIEQKNAILKLKLKEQSLKLKNRDYESKKQQQKLESEIKRLTEILSEKETQIDEFTNSISKLKIDLKSESEEVKKLKEMFKSLEQDENQEMLQKQLKTQSINQLQAENKRFQILIKQFNGQLMEISKMLFEFKSSHQSQEQIMDQVNENGKKVEDIYQSILMEEDSEIKMITQNLLEIQNSIRYLIKIDPFFLNCNNCKALYQELSVFEAENESLHKRISKIKHASSTELNMEVIRRKFSQILSTQGDIYEIDEKLFNLKKSYQDIIEDEYQKAFAQVFQDQDQQKEVMEQLFVMPTSEAAVQSNIWENNSILKEKRQNTKNQNYMPFLFRSKRQFPYDRNEIPPVGAYHVPSVFDKLTSSNVSNQPQILKEQFQRKNQMCIFKSNQSRFLHSKNDIPGPASYNFNNNQSSKKTKGLNHQPQSVKQKYQLIKRSPSCPAIPDSKVRYGYTKDQSGNFRLIQKSQMQVQRQKQKLREYCSTLVGENHYSRNLRVSQDLSTPKINLKHQKVISKLEKFVDKRSSSVNENLLESKDKKPKLTKPKVKLSHGANPVKQSNDHLGPGCYNVCLDTVKKAKQNENFQFFSSSEIRFAPLQKQQNINPYEHIFKEKKNMRIKPNFQGKIYKKSFPTSLDPTCFEKIQNPGPGYYEPEVEKVKKSNGNVRFGYESRFKENIEPMQGNNEPEIVEEIEIDKGGLIWGNLKKEKIRSPHKEYQPVKESEIYGIMNEEVSDSNIHSKPIQLKSSKNKQNAVFLDRSERLNICNKTYYKGESEVVQTESSPKLWETKGSFISKLPKQIFQKKENTPGPGTYDRQKVGKKTFNIKNL